MVQVVLISSAAGSWVQSCGRNTAVQVAVLWVLCAASGQHLQPVLGERHLLVKAYPDKPPITKLDPTPVPQLPPPDAAGSVPSSCIGGGPEPDLSLFATRSEEHVASAAYQGRCARNTESICSDSFEEAWQPIRSQAA